MLADHNERPRVDESYTGAVSGSSLRVGNDPGVRTAGDMIAAAGMNRHRMGLTLLRLLTEWDKSAKPAAPTPEAIEQIAATLAREKPTIEVERDGVKCTVPNPHAGLVRDVVKGAPRYRLPIVAATEIALEWFQQEQLLLLQQLKTLPQVRDALVFWTKQHNIDDGIHLVAPVLLWWLHPQCLLCGGTGVQVIQGTGGRSKNACGACKKNVRRGLELGQANVPHGGRGRKLLAYLNSCHKRAVSDLRDGVQAWGRSSKGQTSRERQAMLDEAARELRVRLESEADGKIDTAATAATFKASMGGKRKIR